MLIPLFQKTDKTHIANLLVILGKSYKESCGKSAECQALFSCINNTCRCIPSEYLNGSQCLTSKYVLKDYVYL